MTNTENKTAQQLQHRRNLVTIDNMGDDTKLTKQECLDLMESAISVADWNALREIVKRDFEFASVPQDMQKLLHQIDGSGLIVRALAANNAKEYGEVPADMIVDLDDAKLGIDYRDDNRFLTDVSSLDDSEG